MLLLSEKCYAWYLEHEGIEVKMQLMPKIICWSAPGMCLIHDLLSTLPNLNAESVYKEKALAGLRISCILLLVIQIVYVLIQGREEISLC